MTWDGGEDLRGPAYSQPHFILWLTQGHDFRSTNQHRFPLPEKLAEQRSRIRHIDEHMERRRSRTSHQEVTCATTPRQSPA